MERGTQTRSGLIWQVEKLLNECWFLDCLPQVLLMENVPQVCGKSNINAWTDWLNTLKELGYKSYYKILNAKDYGIPQNRKRCFMVSILSNETYTFPQPIELKHHLKDFIAKHVDSTYYLSDEIIQKFTFNLNHEQKQENQQLTLFDD